MSLALLPPALLPPDGADAVGDEPAPEADDDEPVVVSVDGLALVLDELPPVSDFAVSLVPLGVVVVDPDDDVDGDVTDAEPDDDVAEPEPDDVADPEADGDVPVAGGDGVDGDVDDGGEADGERPPCAVVSVPDSVQPAAATATIAIPAYNDQVRKARRSEAIQRISDIVLAQERWRGENPAYGSNAQITSPDPPMYTVVISGETATNFVVTATATGDQAKDKGGTCTPLVFTKTATPQRTPEACFR